MRQRTDEIRVAAVTASNAGLFAPVAPEMNMISNAVAPINAEMSPRPLVTYAQRVRPKVGVILHCRAVPSLPAWPYARHWPSLHVG
jgi:hypothetical protein